MFLLVSLLCFLLYSYYMILLGKEKNKNYCFKKRKMVYDALNQVTYSNGTSTHYTIDCTYDNSAKVHTLGCEYSVYEQLKKKRLIL